MAVQRQVGAFMDARPSAVDLTGLEFHFAVLDGNGNLALPVLGGEADGVIQEGKAVGRTSSYATAGQLKVLAGAVINEGDEISAMADGSARVAAAGHEILGRAMSAAAIGELATINFHPKGLHV
jgi:hypothetical protein